MLTRVLFSLAMLSVGMVEFMMDLMDESMAEGIRQLMDRALSLHLNYHQMLFDAGADMTSFGDSSCGPDLISAQLYRNIAMPYHKKNCIGPWSKRYPKSMSHMW